MADRFDKFTERARRVLSFAQEEAQRFNHNYIGTEHLLLGLLREPEGLGATVLANLGVELAKVRSAVEFVIGRGERPPTGEVGLTDRVKRVIELAVEESRRLNHQYIGTEHLLLGLLREGHGVGAGVLESLGVNLERVRTETSRVLAQSGTGARVGRPGYNPPAGGRSRGDRFDTFTESARRVLSLAQEEAQRFNHNYIGTEHLLLGLLRQSESLGAKTIDSLGVSLERTRSAVEAVMAQGPRPPTSQIGLTARARGVIEFAVDEAHRFNHHYVGTEHLLLGMLRVTDGAASGVLESLGVSIAKARDRIAQLLAASEQPTPTSADMQTRPAESVRMGIARAGAQSVRLATGFEFTEGPLWHPDGFFYFCDTRVNRLYKLRPGGEPEVAREDTGRASSVTFDLEGNLVMVEADRRRVVRVRPDGAAEVIAELYEGKKLNRPNDIVCASDGSIYFTDPTLRQPFSIRELETAVYRIAPDGTLHLFAEAEFPNGLALSLDEQTLYVANTRTIPYIQSIAINADKTAGRRRIFADMTGDEPGVPDGMKLDAFGHVYCTGPGGIWVMNTTGALLTILRFPEQPTNMAFGGDDLRTLFVTARTSVYSLQMDVPGHPHPWYARG